TRHPLIETVDAIGTVAARPRGLAALSAPATARVLRIDVAVGERVHAGQALVELDHAPFDAAVGTAQASFDRATRLADQGIAPRKDAETASAELAQAQAALSAAQRNAELATLRTPISG